MPKQSKGGSKKAKKGTKTWLRAWAPILLTIGGISFAYFSGGLSMVFEAIGRVVPTVFEADSRKPTNSLIGYIVQNSMTSVNGPSSQDLVARLDLQRVPQLKVLLYHDEHALTKKHTDTHQYSWFSPEEVLLCVDVDMRMRVRASTQTGVGIGEALLFDGVHVVGVDFSSHIVDNARRSFRHAVDASRLDLYEASVQNMSFLASSSIDKVMHLNCLYFWDDVHASLREIFRVMKPGGVMISASKMRHVKDRRDHVFKNKDISVYMDALERVGFIDVYVQDIRLSTGCPGRHGKSGCHVDRRTHYEAVFASKPHEVATLPE